MNIGFTGTREELTNKQRTALLDLMQNFKGGQHILHHGDCVGADNTAAGFAKALGWYVVGHIPTKDDLRAFFPSDEERPPLPYKARNLEIVRESFCLIACPKDLCLPPSGGTSHTVHAFLDARYKENKERKGPIYVVYNNGSVEKQ